MRKRWKLWGIGLTLVLLPIVALVVDRTLMPGRRITRENRALLKPGMTEAEVEAILGVPPGVYTAFSTYYTPKTGPSGPLTVRHCLDMREKYPIAGRKEWYGNELFIWIDFGPDGRVSFVQSSPARRADFIGQLLGLFR